MTVLGEFVLPHDGSAWTQTIVAALDELGVRDKAARQALARTEDRGWLTRERVGRRTRWHLTPAAVDLLTTGAERIYGFGQQQSWDGRWVLLMASVPERDRAARYRMNRELSWAGFGALGQGTWISPWVERESAVASLIRSLELHATTFVAEVGQLGSGEALARQAWDLPELRAAYDRFLSTELPEHPVAGLAMLVHEWRRFPFVDPGLPAEVLPADWPAAEAAARFAQVRAELREPARQWWVAAEAASS